MRRGAIMISFLLVAITASAVGGENEPALDFKGNPIKVNTRYHVLVSRGGSLNRYKIDPSKGCSKGVANFKSLNPSTFSIVFVSPSDDVVVRVSTQINIKFKIQQPPRCKESMFWRIGQNNSGYEDIVLLGGSKSSNDSLFTIERSPNTVTDKIYKFAFGGADIGFEKPSQIGGIRKMRLLRDSDDSGDLVIYKAL